MILPANLKLSLKLAEVFYRYFDTLLKVDFILRELLEGASPSPLLFARMRQDLSAVLFGR